MGVVLTIVLNIALKNVAPWVFLTIVMSVQVFTNRISINLQDLRVVKDEVSNVSLLTQ